MIFPSAKQSAAASSGIQGGASAILSRLKTVHQVFSRGKGRGVVVPVSQAAGDFEDGELAFSTCVCSSGAE